MISQLDLSKKNETKNLNFFLIFSGTINNHTKVSKSKSTLGYDAYQPVKPPSVSPVRTFDSDSGRGSVDMDRRWSTHNQPIPGQLISTSGGTRPNSQFISGQNGTTGTTSESDDSSLNSVEVEEQQQMLAGELKNLEKKISKFDATYSHCKIEK